LLLAVDVVVGQQRLHERLVDAVLLVLRVHDDAEAALAFDVGAAHAARALVLPLTRLLVQLVHLHASNRLVLLRHHHLLLLLLLLMLLLCRCRSTAIHSAIHSTTTSTTTTTVVFKRTHRGSCVDLSIVWTLTHCPAAPSSQFAKLREAVSHATRETQ
jgi:hypothetical protein